MDPYEERLRDEVIYLHSLWHKGPPRPSNPNSNSIAVSRPANRFKKQHHHHDHHYRMVHHYNHPPSPRRPTSSLEWPVNTAPPKPPPPWPLAMDADSAPKQDADSAPKPDAGSPNQQAKLSSARMQQEVLATFRKFLEKTDGEDSTDDDDDDDVTGEECKEYRFFLEVFVSNAPLREYFEKHHEDGQFWCFACQKNKKFKSCHALLQHAIAISKTAWKRAHSALALVICRVLAWDSKRLPIIERKGVPLSQSLLVQVSNGKRNAVVYFGDCMCVYGKAVLLPHGSDAKSGDTVSFETLSDTDSATANWEAAEVAADAENGIIGHSMEKITGDACQNETDEEVVEDKMDTGVDKNGGSMDKATYDVSQVKTSDEVMNAMQVETSLDTDIATTNGEVSEVAADTVNGISGHSMAKTIVHASINETDGKFFEDAMDTDNNKNCGSVDKTTNDDSWVKTNDKVVEKAMDLGNDVSGGSAEKSIEDSQTNVEIRITETSFTDEIGDIDIENPKGEKMDSRENDECGLPFIDGGSSPPAAVEWPGTIYPKDHSDAAATGWPTLKAPPAPEVQKRAWEACREFFRCLSCGAVSDDNQDEDDKSDDDNSEESEEEEGHADTDEGSEEFEFFMKLFSENADLKTYYERNSGDGEFCCLVCVGVDKKTRKRFRGCQGLLQHTAAMFNTRQKAHRAYKRALKECFGWDVNRLSLLNNSRDSLDPDQSLANSANDSPANIKLEASADGSIQAHGETRNFEDSTNDASNDPDP